MLTKLLSPYRKVESNVRSMIVAEYFIQLVNAAFMMVLDSIPSKDFDSISILCVKYLFKEN